MAKFKLTKCHLREGKFAPDKGTPRIELDWDGLVGLVAPESGRDVLLRLRGMRLGTYVGLIKRDGKDKNFIFRNDNGSPDVQWVIDNDPTFGDRLTSVYCVDEITLDSVTSEQLEQPEQVKNV